jgi:hypothetical protein
MLRWLYLLTLIGCIALNASSSHAAGAMLICETAPGVRTFQRVDGYPTKAGAEVAVRARCRAAAATLRARAARAESLPQVHLSSPTPKTAPIQDRACRRYPNLC